MRYEISTGNQSAYTDDLPTAQSIARALSSESGAFTWVWGNERTGSAHEFGHESHVARYYNGEDET